MKLLCLLSSVAAVTLAQSVLVESAQPGVTMSKPQQYFWITVSTIQDAVLAVNNPASLKWIQSVSLDSLKSLRVEKVAAVFARNTRNSARLVVENPEAAAAVLKAKNEGQFDAVLKAFQSNPEAQEISDFVQEAMESKGLNKRMNGNDLGQGIGQAITALVVTTAVVSAVGGAVIWNVASFIAVAVFK